MKIYCIYDNLYEEYQQPFCMKNDNIAKIEFEMFVNNAVDKAPEKEKAKTRNRFILCSFPLGYNKDTGYILHYVDTTTPPINIKPEPMAIGDIDE